MRPQGPFALIDAPDAAGGTGAWLLTDPVGIIRADRPAEVDPALDAIDAASGAGQWVAGYLAYDAGAALEPSLSANDIADAPLMWFGRFAGASWLAADAVDGWLAAASGGASAVRPAAPVPTITQADHAAMVDEVRALIDAGDVYQINLTFPAHVALIGDPVAQYRALRARAVAGEGALLWTGTDWILSASPELFFDRDGDALLARPMKGTAARDPDPARDAMVARRLADDPKQRAENLMIVDLIRNDLSRVAAPGSVAVPSLFRVQTLPTVHQLVSDVTARARQGVTTGMILRAMFPCGSVTGAPKIRAMRAIAAIEGQPRGVYTGSIGIVRPGGDARFNVAIRTLTLRRPADGDGLPADAWCATLGLGSGIVADSDAGDEWSECLAKGGFVRRGDADQRSAGGDAAAVAAAATAAPRRRPIVADPRFPVPPHAPCAAAMRADLLETMRFDPDAGIVHLDLHLARMKAAADWCGRRFDRHMVRNQLQALTMRTRRAARVRLRLGAGGGFAAVCDGPPATPAMPLRIRLVPLPVAPDDWRLRVKSSDRAFYDAARRAGDADEVIFVAPDGRCTEGSFTSLFAGPPDRLITPAPARDAGGNGLLPGVLGTALVAEGRASWGDVRPSDLAGGFMVGNALRGLMPARLVAD